MKRHLTNKQLESAFHEIEACDTFECTQDVMKTIKSGQVKRRARWFVLMEYFSFRTSWILLVFLLVALININLFMLAQSPEWHFLDFGSSGINIFVRNLPYGWWALAFSLMIIAILAARHFSRSYILPFKVIIVSLVVGVFSIGTVTFATGINDNLYEKYVENGEGNPLIAKLYCLCANRLLQSNKAMFGEVMFVSNSNFVVQTPDLEVFVVESNKDTLWLDTAPLEQYQVVRMLGEKVGDTFYATHIKIHDEETMRLVRESEECTDKAKWQEKNDIAEKRRQVVHAPQTPVIPPVQLIKNIF